MGLLSSLMPVFCSAQPHRPPKASPTLTPPDNGRCASSNGTTMSIAIAASATSPRRSVMPGRMGRCLMPVTHSTRTPGSAIRNAGVGRPATGHRLASSPSIQSVTLSFGRRLHKSSFPVRSASLLSRPDLATPRPRRATQGMGLGRGERTNRSHPQPRAERPGARAWRGW
jgi:hypothetical protein